MREKKLYYIIVLSFLLLVNTMQAQSLAFKKTNMESVSGNYFSLNDSVMTSSIVFNNSIAVKSLKIGAWSGLVGAAIGLALVPILITDAVSQGYAYVSIPPALGAISFVLGTVVGYLINNNEIDAYSKRPLNQIGVGVSFFLPTNYNYYGQEFSFSLSYRNLNDKYYLPNRISLLYSNTDEMHYNYFEKDRYIWSDGTSISIEGVHINYNKVFSLLYGFELGFFSASAYKHSSYWEIISHKNITTPFIDLIVGFNINILTFLSLECSFKYEPYGPYQKFKPVNSELASVPYKITTSLLLFF